MSPRVQAVLIGGAFIGVLSALPILAMGNCCCLWVGGGGLISAYLQQQAQSDPLQLGDGAVAGFLAGVLGAVVYTVVAIPVQLVTQPFVREIAEGLARNAELPPEVAEMLAQMPDAGLLQIMIGFVFMLVIGAMFSTLGGVLGAAIFGRNRPAPSPDVA